MPEFEQTSSLKGEGSTSEEESVAVKLHTSKASAQPKLKLRGLNIVTGQRPAEDDLSAECDMWRRDIGISPPISASSTVVDMGSPAISPGETSGGKYFGSSGRLSAEIATAVQEIKSELRNEVERMRIELVKELGSIFKNEVGAKLDDLGGKMATLGQRMNDLGIKESKPLAE